MKLVLAITLHLCIIIGLIYGCRDTKHGCCPDGKSVVKGPNLEGCKCETTKYGCCPDGITAAKGEDLEGCDKLPLLLSAICTLEKDRGGCKNYSVKFFFDKETGSCTRFWYSGCGGNANQFDTEAECNEVCVKSLHDKGTNNSTINGTNNTTSECTDNPITNCTMIVQKNCCAQRYCTRFCCKSCTAARQLHPTVLRYY